MTDATFNRKVRARLARIREGRSYQYHYKASRRAGNDATEADLWALGEAKESKTADREAAARRKAWTMGSDSLGDWNGRPSNWSDVPPQGR
jgi:hypothetical protein